MYACTNVVNYAMECNVEPGPNGIKQVVLGAKLVYGDYLLPDTCTTRLAARYLGPLSGLHGRSAACNSPHLRPTTCFDARNRLELKTGSPCNNLIFQNLVAANVLVTEAGTTQSAQVQACDTV